MSPEVGDAIFNPNVIINNISKIFMISLSFVFCVIAVEAVIARVKAFARFFKK